MNRSRSEDGDELFAEAAFKMYRGFAGQVGVGGSSWFVTLPPMSISTIEIF